MKQTEYELQCKCVLVLEDLQKYGVVKFFTAIPNSTFTKSWAVKRKNTLSGVRSGLCDLFILIDGECYFVELKTLTGTLQPSQKEVIKALNKKGRQAYICCDLEEFVVLMNDLIAKKDDIYFKANLKGARMLKKLMNYA